MHDALKFAYHRWVDAPERWYPLLGVYYLTYACDFRCPYCSDGQKQPYYRLPSARLEAAEVLALLRSLRRHTRHVVLTGGEPFKHPELGAVLEGLPALRFASVILTTNGYELDAQLDAVARSVTHLTVSLDTLDTRKADRWHGVNPGSLERILGNLERAAGHPRRRFEIVISSVVTPENLDDLREVYAFARTRKFRFAACPQLVGVKAHPRLEGNPDYREFYDFLIAEKRAGRRIQGTVEYLAILRDLSRFSCRPFTMVVAAPTGEVFYPCLELGHFAGNLLQEPDLHRLRRRGRERFGDPPRCGVQCHSACALGFASLLAHPLSAVREGWLLTKGRLRGY